MVLPVRFELDGIFPLSTTRLRQTLSPPLCSPPKRQRPIDLFVALPWSPVTGVLQPDSHPRRLTNRLAPDEPALHFRRFDLQGGTPAAPPISTGSVTSLP